MHLLREAISVTLCDSVHIFFKIKKPYSNANISFNVNVRERLTCCLGNGFIKITISAYIKFKNIPRFVRGVAPVKINSCSRAQTFSKNLSEVDSVSVCARFVNRSSNHVLF